LRQNQDEGLQKELQEVDQAIIISFNNGLFGAYQPYLKKDIPVKCIAEHDNSCISIYNISEKNQFERGLGLSKFGIKIKDIPHLSPRDAWNVIEKHHPELSAQLLKHTHSTDFESFYEKNLLVPAYSNNPMDFADLVNVFVKNQSLSGEKNIIFFQSGFKYSEHLNSPEFQYGLTEKKLVGSKIAKIDLLMPANAPLQVAGNQAESKTISIFSGFYLLDPAYDAIYQLAKVAGVSGDTSLEHAISMNVLPFYWSTNSGNKRETIRQLHKITQLLDITPEAKRAFNIFYDQTPFAKPVYDIDFQDMIEAWPKVTAYLRAHKNFYDKLEGIVLEGLPLKASLDMRQNTTDAKQKLQALIEDGNPSGIDKPSGSCNIS